MAKPVKSPLKKEDCWSFHLDFMNMSCTSLYLCEKCVCWYSAEEEEDVQL